jgi:enoyl-CoA hydratase/carnithine racemase
MSKSKSREPAVTAFTNLVLVEERSDLATRTINPPEKRDAMSVDSMARLRDEIPYAIGRVKTDGGSIFTAGLDLALDGAKVDMPWTASWNDVNVEVTRVRFTRR